MILQDTEILKLGEKIIYPFDPTRVQPASYDLTLYDEFLYPFPTGDFGKSKLGIYVLAPKECVLASTAEFVTCPRDLAARVEGKSSLGRLFLAVHVTAGWIDPGFSGRVTLELVNHSPWPITITAGMKIAQVNFMRLEKPCAKPYGHPDLGSHYQGQMGPRESAP